MTRSPVPRQRRLEMLDTLTPPPPCLPASRTTAIRHPFSGYHSPCMRACMCNRGSEGASHSTGPTVPHRHRHRTHHEGAKDALALATHVGAVRAAHVPSQSARDREPHRVAHKRGVRVTCGLRWVGRVACVWCTSKIARTHIHTTWTYSTRIRTWFLRHATTPPLHDRNHSSGCQETSARR